jgi:predicted signal transduction protein with EAL and GGDEF domain
MSEPLSRKQVLNPAKIIPETPAIESPDVFATMGTILKISGEQLQIGLPIVLLLACAANLTLVWWWLV